MSLSDSLGATYLGNGQCRFLVWAPLARKLELRIVAPAERLAPMAPRERGYYECVLEGVEPGTLYFYRLDGDKDRPDPASRSQPNGVHGPSQVIDPLSFAWEDRGWYGRRLADFIIYELHVGTFAPEGTFGAIIPYLDELMDLGITAIELMPVGQFPGNRNWGYDGVQPFAVQNSYGGPEGLMEFVNACHLRGLAVILDVVYNHLGPDGNYLGDFAPYFTDRYRTPWGPAVNFDGPHSDEVRRYCLQNALHWFTGFHVDALRLDSVHAIADFSALPFLQELAIATHRQAELCNRKLYLIAESDLNDARIIRPQELGGYGLDAQWSDDFHHALHSVLTGERLGYYEDFGNVEHLARAFRDGFVYSGQRSTYRQRRHGNSPRLNAAHQFVVCSQNHDQVGNRMLGERISRLVSFDSLKLAAGSVLLSSFVPLLFMGEEYGETAPFLYFTSHTEEALIEAVRKGRRQEFAAFRWQGEVPDPQAETTFLASKLQHKRSPSQFLRRRRRSSQGRHRVLWEFYQELIRLRKTQPALAHLSKEGLDVAGYENLKTLFVRRRTGEDEAVILFNFGDARAVTTVPATPGSWLKKLDSSDRRWLGKGCLAPQLVTSPGTVTLTLHPRSFVVFIREEHSLPL